MAEPQNKVADLIKSQGKAFRAFRKTQEALVEDVAKRVDKLEGKRVFTVTAPGYSELFDSMADALRIAAEQAKAQNQFS